MSLQHFLAEMDGTLCRLIAVYEIPDMDANTSVLLTVPIPATSILDQAFDTDTGQLMLGQRCKQSKFPCRQLGKYA